MSTQKKIAELSAARGGTTVISYVTSTRAGCEVQMGMDTIPIFYEHLRRIRTPRDETKIDLLIHSNGGDGVVPWRLVTLLREFCGHLAVLVPNRAFSAATLTALGADEVVMHPMGMLGPTDPTVTTPYNPIDPRNNGQLLGISVEDVASYIRLVREDVGINHEDELVQAFLALTAGVHPLALGSVKRSTSQSRMMGERLLSARNGGDVAQHETAEIIRQLTSQLYYHGHPINRNEARESLGLRFVADASPEVETTMWDLFADYADLMELHTEFRPIDQFAQKLALPAVGAVPNATGPHPLAPNVLVVVESEDRADHYLMTFEVTARREWTGQLSATVQPISQAWSHIR
jgi:hypothetical protein